MSEIPIFQNNIERFYIHVNDENRSTCHLKEIIMRIRLI